MCLGTCLGKFNLCPFVPKIGAPRGYFQETAKDTLENGNTHFAQCLQCYLTFFQRF